MHRKRNTLNRGSRAKDFLVRVQSSKDASIQGVVTHLASQQSQPFRSLLELISLLHDRLEEIGMPVADVELRSWPRLHLALEKKEESSMDDRPDGINETRVGDSAFLVRIIFRQNATWMGEIHWLNGERKIYFRSLMEMIMLMHEALERSGIPPAEYRFRTWEDLEEASLQRDGS